MDQVSSRVGEVPSADGRIVVLLVDDQRFVGVALEQLLASERDIALHCCTEATEAVAVANRLAPNIILQDLHMPDIDGLTLVQQFRGNPSTASVPIVLLSANDDAETRRRAFAAGVVDYLVKLPAKGNLIACLRRLAGIERRSHADVSRAMVAGPAARTLQESASGSSLDPAVLEMYRQSASPEFVQRLIDQFLNEATGRLETLRRAASRGSAHTTKATAHALKGGSAIVGATRLAQLCERLESCAGTPQPDAARLSALADDVDQEFERVRALLHAQINP